MLQRPEISAGLMGHVARMQTLPYICTSSNLISSILFADDTNLLMSHKNLNTLIDKMNEELVKINTWLQLNYCLILQKLILCCLNHQGKKINKEPKIKIKDNYITQAKNTKFVGTIIDNQLKWKEHINFVANKISRFTGILCKARHFVTRSLLRSIYYALIYPYIFFMAMWYGLMRISLILRKYTNYKRK